VTFDVRWSKAAAAKDLEETVAYYSEDAIVLPQIRRAQRRRQAIRMSGKNTREPGPSWSLESARVELGKSGRHAWVSGTYELTIEIRLASRSTTGGKYLEGLGKTS